MVAAVCTWHERHPEAAAAIETRLRRGERLTVAAHALVETYAVLTRLPPPHRLAPADAWTLVKENFIANAAVVALSASDHATLLGRLAKAGVRGGRTYDGLIAVCAERTGAVTLLTFNPRHFDPPPKGVEVVEPHALP
jgi:predicted nucleic acid-binding protein